MSGGLTRRAAMGLVAGGAVLTIAESRSFSQVNAGRGVSISTASDPDALLGIEGRTDPSTTPQFSNNSNVNMTLDLDSPDDIEFDVGDNGNWTLPPVTVSLAAGGSEDVNIRYVGDCTDAGQATVEATAVLKDSAGTNEATIDLTRPFEIPESGQVQFSGNVQSSGSSGKYEFEVLNEGCADVTLSGIGINETTTAADYVSGGGSLYNVNTDEALVTDRIPIDNNTPTDDTRRDLDPTLSLPQGGSVDLEFVRFQRDVQGKSNVDMRGQDVRVTLYFTDGSSSTVKLCNGSCDF